MELNVFVVIVAVVVTRVITGRHTAAIAAQCGPMLVGTGSITHTTVFGGRREFRLTTVVDIVVAIAPATRTFDERATPIGLTCCDGVGDDTRRIAHSAMVEVNL